MDKQQFLDKLAERRPEALESYTYDKLPDSFPILSKVTITCKKHGDFQQLASNHLHRSGCPTCGHQKASQESLGRVPTTEEYVKKVKSKFGDKYDYNKTVYRGKDSDVTIGCPVHGEFIVKAVWHKNSPYGCPKCDVEINREIRKKNIVESARRAHGDRYDYSKVVYVNANEPVEIVCRTHGSFWQDMGSHVLRVVGCPKCAKALERNSQEDFIALARKVHGDRYDYSKTNYVTNLSMVTITCKKHGDFVQRAGSHLAGTRCSICAFEDNRLSVEEFVKKAREVHGDTFDYSKVVYTGNKTPVEIICPKHGSFWQKPNTHTSSRNGCTFCYESKGEKAVEVFLKKYGIEHIREYRIMPHRYRYDFYLPLQNIFVEFHGHQHFKPVEFFGGKEAFDKLRGRDTVKRALVTENGGFLITITYRVLSDNAIEEKMIASLKLVYKCWLVVSGETKAFKTVNDAALEYGVQVGASDIETLRLILESNESIQELFPAV